MKKFLLSVGSMLLACSLLSSDSQAMDNLPAKSAATSELPAALQAINVQPKHVLTTSEARQVRGQWIMTLNLPFYATQIQGYQPFTLQLWTVGMGIAPGTPVYVRVSVGY